MPLEPSLFRVLQVVGDKTKVRGTAFLVAPQLAVTCAHVVEGSKSGPGQTLVLQCFESGVEYSAQVLTAGYSPPDVDDVAFLQLSQAPAGMTPVKLGSAEERSGRDFVASGFPDFDDYTIGHAYGQMRGVSPKFSGGHPVLQLPQDTLTHGFSGCPILDKAADRVVGMVSLGLTLEHATLVYAVTADTLVTSRPDLRLWPDEPPPAAGPTTNFHGPVTGPILTGQYNAPVNIGNITTGKISDSAHVIIGHGTSSIVNTGSGAVATSGGVAASTGGDAVGGNVSGDIGMNQNTRHGMSQDDMGQADQLGRLPTESMMLCPKCNHANLDTAKFCNACGARLTTGSAAPTTSMNDVTGPVLSGLFHGTVIIGNVTYTTAQADDTPDRLGRYLDWLIGVCAPLKLKAINQSAVSSDKQPLGLASVYVDLNLDFSLPTQLTLAKYLAQRDHAETMRDPEKTRLAAALEALAAHPRLVLLGAPGSGKSTLSLYLALSLAQAALGEPTALARLGATWGYGALLPVRVELRKFAASLPDTLQQATAKHLWDFIANEIAGEGLHATTGAVVQATAQKTGALFLLDGLDEAGDEHRRARVLEAVTAFTTPTSAGAHSRFLLTARPYAWEKSEKSTGATLADNAAVYRLADFDNAQIQTFIQRWYEAVSALGWMNASEAREKTAALQDAVHRADLSPLAHNPLLLTLMATLHSNRTRLPEDRAELYNEVVELLLQRWNESSGADRGLLDALKIDTLKLANLREKIELLAFEAHSAHVGKDGTADVSEAELLEVFGPLLNHDLNKARQVVEYIEKRAGLLLGQGARGRVRQFTFPHRTFQEYLAACHLAARVDFVAKAAELAYADPAHWREVLRLAARRAPAGWGVLAADELVHGQNVQDWQADNAVTDRDWQAALLAGEQLLEIGLAVLDSEAGYRAKRKRVAGWVAALLQHGALPDPDRARAGTVLAQLGDPRPGVELVRDRVGLADRRGLAENETRLWGDQPEHLGLPDMVWVKVVGGSITIGREQFAVQPFYMAKYPVTYTHFQAFVEAKDGFANPRWWKDLAATDTHKRQPDGQRFRFGNHPRENVSWYDALAFCHWLNARLGWPDLPAQLTVKTLDTYSGLRLPTEWEWQWAASPQGKQYPWGDEWDSAKANTSESGLRRTTTVGMYPTGAAPCGALDLSGNVWEWCLNEYSNVANVNLSGSETRVVRGGSWYLNRDFARAAHRLFNYPDNRNDRLGFRLCVRPPSLSHR